MAWVGGMTRRFFAQQRLNASNGEPVIPTLGKAATSLGIPGSFARRVHSNGT